MNQTDLKTLLHETSIVNLMSLMGSYGNVEEGLFVIDAIRAQNDFVQVEAVFSVDDTKAILVGNDSDYATKISIDFRLSSSFLSELLVDNRKSNFKHLRWSFELPITVIYEHELTIDLCKHGRVIFDDDEKQMYQDFGDLTNYLFINH